MNEIFFMQEKKFFFKKNDTTSKISIVSCRLLGARTFKTLAHSLKFVHWLKNYTRPNEEVIFNF